MLDAVEKNPSVAGTLANKISSLDNKMYTKFHYIDVKLRENKTFDAGEIDGAPIELIDGYHIVAVSPWVIGDWSDGFALISYHGYLGGYCVYCRNIDSDMHAWTYGALVLYEKNEL